MRKIILPIFLVTFTVFSLLVHNYHKSSRVSYESFLRDHPYINERLDPKEIKKMDRKNRPDLAFRQNFLMTMNPDLKRPTPELLPAILQEVKMKQMQRAPGSIQTPFVERGPNNVGGRTRAIVFDPNDDTNKKVWAGGVSGGLWVNNDITDANSEWTAVGNMWDNISIGSIAFDPNDASIIYVGTGESYTSASKGAGIWKSTDGGANFTQLPSTSDFFYVNDMIVRNEDGTSVLYVGISGGTAGNGWFGMNEAGLYRSINGGSSFSQVLPTIQGSRSYPVNNIELDANNNLWLGTKSSYYSGTDAGGRIFSSADGTNWTERYTSSGSGRLVVACAPSNANYIYALVEKEDQLEKVIRSTNGGTNFSEISEPQETIDNGIPADDFTRGQADYDLTIAVDPNNAERIVAGGINLFISSNGGSSWSQISKWSNGFAGIQSYVHADQHTIIFAPGSSNSVLFGNDGGVFYTSDLSSSSSADVIEARNKGYNVTQFYACAIGPNAGSNMLLAGTQDNGTQYFLNPGMNSTIEVTGGDGGYCFIDQSNDDVQITSYVYNNYYVTDNGWNNYSQMASDQNGGLFINPADYDDRQNVLFSSYSETELAITTNVESNPNYQVVGGFDFGAITSHLRVSPYTTNSSTLFAGTTAGRLFKITNANSAPSVLEIGSNSFPTGWLSCVEFGASEEEILITFTNYGVTSVWYTSDGGGNWVSKEGNLPDLPVRWAMFNPNDRSEVILATDLGVWATNNFNADEPSWTSSNEGLATVRVDMFQMRESDFEVVAATYGRGLFTSDAFGASIAPTANFSVSSDTVLMGEKVQYSDISVGSPTSFEWTFEGGNPSSSSEENPEVVYDTSGSFDVTLVVTNNEGSDDTMVANFITVLEVTEGCDTITKMTSNGSGPYGLSGGTGTFTGHNSAGSQGYAMYYDNVDKNVVSGLDVGVYSRIVNSGGGVVKFRVYDDGDTPGAILGEKTVLISDMANNTDLTVDFDQPVAVGRSFYVGYEIDYITTDSFAVKMQTGNDDNDGFIKTGDGTWRKIKPYLGVNIGLDLTISACRNDFQGAVNASFTGTPLSVLQGDEVTFTNYSYGDSLSYEWIFVDGVPSTSSQEHPVVRYDSVGVFDVTLIVSNGEDSDTLIRSDYITVADSSNNGGSGPDPLDSIVVGDCGVISNIAQNENLTAYGLGNGWGIWTGHSSLGFTKFAEKYTGVTSGNAVGGITLAVLRSVSVNAGASVDFVVYDGGELPGEELYRQSYLLNQFTPQAYNEVTFDEYVVVGEEFYVGWEINYASNSDSFAVYQTEDTDPTNTGYFYQNSWDSWENLFSNPAWNTSFAFYPNVCEVEIIPTASFDIPETVCLGDSVLVNNQTTGTVDSYQWSYGADAHMSTSNYSKDHNVLYNSTGLKTIQLIATDANGNSDTIEHSLEVIQSPTAEFTISSNTVETDETIIITNNSTHAQSFAWTFGDGNSSTSTEPTHSYETAGNYTITLVAIQSSCEASAIQNVTVSEPVVTFLSEIEDDFLIYPNPAVSEIKVEWNGRAERVELYNAVGGLVQSLEIIEQGSYRLDVSHLNKGQYFVRIIKGENVVQKAFMKN